MPLVITTIKMFDNKMPIYSFATRTSNMSMASCKSYNDVAVNRDGLSLLSDLATSSGKTLT